MVQSRLVQPFWRSILFVPALVQRFVQKAPDVGADALMLDLEDSIAAGQKGPAREAAARIAPEFAAAGHEVFVRINRPWRLAVPDLEAVVGAHLTALTLPMVDSAAHVQAVAEVVAELEQERGVPLGQIRFLVLVETAQGFLRLAEIAAAHPRIAALGLGSEDFAADLQAEPSAEVLLGPKQQLIVAARAAGVRPMGFIGSVADFRDVEALSALMVRSRRFGLQGASCIHPNQVIACNAGFAPGAEEVARAKRVVEAYEAALEQGVGAIVVEGKMVDVPVWQRAQAVLELHQAILRRQR